MKKIRKDTAGIKKTQVNRKLHYKKMAALAVAGVLVAGSTLTGCVIVFWWLRFILWST